jgi:hypothetical protein
VRDNRTFKGKLNRKKPLPDGKALTRVSIFLEQRQKELGIENSDIDGMLKRLKQSRKDN